MPGAGIDKPVFMNFLEVFRLIPRIIPVIKPILAPLSRICRGSAIYDPGGHSARYYHDGCLINTSKPIFKKNLKKNLMMDLWRVKTWYIFINGINN